MLATESKNKKPAKHSEKRGPPLAMTKLTVGSEKINHPFLSFVFLLSTTMNNNYPGGPPQQQQQPPQAPNLASGGFQMPNPNANPQAQANLQQMIANNQQRQQVLSQQPPQQQQQQHPQMQMQQQQQQQVMQQQQQQQQQPGDPSLQRLPIRAYLDQTVVPILLDGTKEKSHGTTATTVK